MRRSLCDWDKPKFTEADRDGLQWRIDNRIRQISDLQKKIDKLTDEIKIFKDIIATL